ncbi:MAG TPA: hypothetical protein VLH85_01800 [Levilinea sp.]|nr:hypothetical protein [Levilinea sp.]
MISEIEASYTAGIIDGEGSIALTRNHSERWPSPQVSVASTDRELLDWLRCRYGGSITIKQPRQPQHSLSFDWKLTDRRALHLLQIVRPYLVIERKIRRCDLLLFAYLDCTPRNGRYSQEMLKKKQSFLEQFASLP